MPFPFRIGLHTPDISPTASESVEATSPADHQIRNLRAKRCASLNCCKISIESVSGGDGRIKRSRFGDEQIIKILKEQKAGDVSADVCRRHVPGSGGAQRITEDSIEVNSPPPGVEHRTAMQVAPGALLEAAL